MLPAISVVFVLLLKFTSSYYEYVGCYEKEEIDATLEPKVFHHKYSGMPRLALSVCLLECESYGYHLTALDTTHCGCAGSVGRLRKETGCTTPCRTRPFPNVPCGGSMRLAVYRMSSKLHQKIYVGCYELLPLDEDTKMTPLRDNSPFSGAAHLVERFVASSCIKHCAKSSYAYAALYNGDYCGCDDSLDTSAAVRHVNCTIPCEDVKLGTCGASDDKPVVSVWKSDAAAIELLPDIVDEKFNEEEFSVRLDAGIDSEDEQQVQEFKILESGKLEWTNKQKKTILVRYERDHSSGDGSDNLSDEDGPSGNGKNPLDADGSGESEDSRKSGNDTKASGNDVEKQKEEYYDTEEDKIVEDEAGTLGLPIGLGVGAGVTVIVIVIVALAICLKRKRSKVHDSSDEEDGDNKKKKTKKKGKMSKDRTKKDKTNKGKTKHDKAARGKEKTDKQKSIKDVTRKEKTNINEKTKTKAKANKEHSSKEKADKVKTNREKTDMNKTSKEKGSKDKTKKDDKKSESLHERKSSSKERSSGENAERRGSKSRSPSAGRLRKSVDKTEQTPLLDKETTTSSEDD